MNDLNQKIRAAFMIGGVAMLSSCGNNNLGEESPHGEDGVNNLENVSLEMTESAYQPEEDTFELRVINHSESEITYGVEYMIEYEEDGTWYEVEPDEEMAFILIAHILDPGEEAVEEINLSYYEPLEAGSYRLIRKIDGTPLAANFEVID